MISPVRHLWKLLALAGALLAVVLPSATSEASHSWGTYHWARTTNPFTLQLEDDLTSAEWKGFLGATSADWSDSAVLDTSVVNYAGPKRNCPAIAGKVRVCNRKYGFNGWLGLATIWIWGSHITQGTAKVNDSYFDSSGYNNADAKRHVLCQEVGHTFGLDHQGTGTGSCMNGDIFDPNAVSPNAHDYEQLGIIYGSHTDSTTTVSTSSAPGNGRGARGDEPEGAVPPGAGPRHGNLFVRDLGGGRLLVTFVIWAQAGGAP